MNIDKIDYLKYDNFFNGDTNHQYRYMLFLLCLINKFSILESRLISIMGTKLVWKIYGNPKMSKALRKVG
jgi:hypothetical protein